MSTNIDTLREAAKNLVAFHNGPLEGKRPDMFSKLMWRLEEALAASKPEPQAQAGEPEVVAWLCPRVAPYFYQPLTHWCAEPPEPLTRQEAIERGWFPVIKQEAIAKKDAALKACVEAMEIGKDIAMAEGWDHDVSTINAAITQAQEAQR